MTPEAKAELKKIIARREERAVRLSKELQEEFPGLTREEIADEVCSRISIAHKRLLQIWK
jgi:hypothetical protein